MFARLSLLAASAPWKPEFWLEKAGGSAAYVVTAIIFAESGLFFGFFLPGDSLLFLSGFLTSGGAHDYVQLGQPGHALAPVVDGMPHLFVLLPMFFLAAVLGDQVGYQFGKRVGPALFTREDSRLFKQSHVTKAHDFLEKYGPKTVLIARFVPIVRTFAPIVAGVGGMKYRTFVIYNFVGALIWAVGLTTLGAVLGEVGFIRDHIEIAVLGIVFLSILPVLIELYRSRKHQNPGTPLAEGFQDIEDALTDEG
ncbi:VTT domain-containing protein [Aquihabitans sp. G128]|uniref:DedA family protein n=1 Tax=Aquihabitans sp. G128 TaxID=2849779 RepID=UPI001C225505|nr:VTT domain-containing protein [Aquihabitans sp. G128]QXC60407.1 VTT domain-containing protein [Aquihabitans sp. G128]